VIILGSGIAGGIIKDGRIHSGRDFTAGEFSYLITDPKEHGDLGCAYMSAAMHGLTYRMCKAKNLDLSVQDSASILEWLDSRIGKSYYDPDGELRKIKADGVQMFEWLSEGDPDVESIYRNFVTSLAVVVHSIQICFAPEKIAIGGGLSLQERIFDDLNEELERYYQGMGLGKQLHAEVVKSRYLNECNLIGAMYNYRLHNS
jgi:predicted NBD/HSP70 family sugar kinase